MPTTTWQGPELLILDTEASSDYIPGAHRIHIHSLIPPMVKDDNGEWQIVPLTERGLVDQEGKPTEAWSYYEAVNYLKDNWDKLPYKHLAIDTFNNFVDWVNDYILQEIIALDAQSKVPKYQEATDISEIEFAVGTAKARAKIQEKITELLSLVSGTGQLLLGVQLENTITIRSGKQVIPQQRMSGIPDKLSKWLTGHAETIVSLQRSVSDSGNTIHTASFDGQGESIMGSRLDPLKGKTLIFAKRGEHSLYSQMRELMDNYDNKEVIPDLETQGPITVARPDYTQFRNGSLHLVCGQPKSGKSTVIADWGLYKQAKKEETNVSNKPTGSAKSAPTEV